MHYATAAAFTELCDRLEHRNRASQITRIEQIVQQLVDRANSAQPGPYPDEEVAEIQRRATIVRKSAGRAIENGHVDPEPPRNQLRVIEQLERTTRDAAYVIAHRS